MKGVKRAPVPINVFAKAESTEGTPYIGAGFPLVGLVNQVAETKGNPSVTITGGRIAALKRDEHGQLVLLQVDGSLQPGNSGGPILEEKTGKLLGVAVARSDASPAFPTSGLSFRPTKSVDALPVAWGRRGNSPRRSEGNCRFAGEGADRRSQEGWCRGGGPHPPASAGSISPNSDGSWPPLPNTKPSS